MIHTTYNVNTAFWCKRKNNPNEFGYFALSIQKCLKASEVLLLTVNNKNVMVLTSL